MPLTYRGPEPSPSPSCGKERCVDHGVEHLAAGMNKVSMLELRFTALGCFGPFVLAEEPSGIVLLLSSNPSPVKAGHPPGIKKATLNIPHIPRGPIYTTIMELGHQNHNGDGLLGANSIMVVYMDPLGYSIIVIV